MYKTQTIQAALKDLIGFKQTENPDYPQLMPWLLESESGLFFEGFHSLITIENIYVCAPRFVNYTYVAWSAVTTYTKGQIVKNGNVLFESLQNANLNNALPGSGSNDYWRETNGISIYLERLKLASIDKVLSNIVEKKKLDRNTKTILEDMKLYEGAGNFQNKVIKRGRFVGWAISLNDFKDLKYQITKIGTQFDAVNNPFTIYLYHSSQEEPVNTFELNLTKQISFEWTAVTDCILEYDNDNYSPGGTFYLGYYESDLTGQAIERQSDLSIAPCASCTGNNSVRAWENWSRFLKIRAFSVSSSDLNGVNLWDISKNVYSYETNWGLNISVKIECDITQFICRNKSVLKDILGKQVAADIISDMAYNTRNNAESIKLRELALFSIDNRDNNSPGIKADLDRAIKAAEFDFSDINKICLPVNNGRSVKYGSF